MFEILSVFSGFYPMFDWLKLGFCLGFCDQILSISVIYGRSSKLVEDWPWIAFLTSRMITILATANYLFLWPQNDVFFSNNNWSPAWVLGKGSSGSSSSSWGRTRDCEQRQQLFKPQTVATQEHKQIASVSFEMLILFDHHNDLWRPEQIAS